MWGKNQSHGYIFSDAPKFSSGLSNDVRYEPPSGVPIELIPDDHNSDSRYVLSGPQRATLLNGTHFHHKNDEILKKRDLLVERIHHLIYDAALLDDSPYMTRESWETGPVERKEKISAFAALHNELRSESNKSGEPVDAVFRAIISDSDLEFVESSTDVLEVINEADIGAILTNVAADQSTGKNKAPSDTNKTSAAAVFDAIAIEADRDTVMSTSDVLTIVHDANISEIISDLEAGKYPDRDDRDIDHFPDVEEKDVEHYETKHDSPEDLWESVIDTPQTNLSIGTSQLTPSNHSQPAELGFEVGNVIRTIMIDQDAVDDLIWGFILALIGKPSVEITAEKRELSELITQVEQMHKSRVQHAHNMADYHESEYSGKSYNSVTVEEVENAGLNPNPVILRAIGHHAVEPHDGYNYTKHVRGIIAKAKEKVPLVEVDDFANTVADDVDVISSRGARDLDSISDALANLWSYDDGSNPSSDDLTDGLDVTKGSVTEALHWVSQDTPRDEIVTQRALLNKTTSETTPSWDLTQYGQVVCKTKFDHDGELDWIYRYAIGAEELSLHERIVLSHCLDDFGYVAESSQGD